MRSCAESTKRRRKRREEHHRPSHLRHTTPTHLVLARTHANMRTKQPIRRERDHFMHLDCLESDHIEPVKMLVKPKAFTKVASSPTSVFAPMSAAPPTMKLPKAVAKPRLPRASVWPHGEKVPWPVPLVPRAHANLATCYPGRLLTRPHGMRGSGCVPLYAPRTGCYCRCKAAHSAPLDAGVGKRLADAQARVVIVARARGDGGVARRGGAAEPCQDGAQGRQRVAREGPRAQDQART